MLRVRPYASATAPDATARSYSDDDEDPREMDRPRAGSVYIPGEVGAVADKLLCLGADDVVYAP